MPTLTIDGVKKFYRRRDVREAVAAVLEARAEADRVATHVEGYLNPAFAEFAPFFRGFGRLDPRSGERITDRKDLHMSDDEQQCAAWYRLCDALHAENGYKVAAGVCPALAADYRRIERENELLALIEPLLGYPIVMMEHRKKALDLFINPPMVNDLRKVLP